jgi:hypothetical protein
MTSLRSRRLEALFNGPIAEASFERIAALANGTVAEDYDLDFKSELYPQNDKQPSRTPLAGSSSWASTRTIRRGQCCRWPRWL